MIKKKSTIIRRFRGVFAGFLMFLGLVACTLQPVLNTGSARAIET